ncbi:MAG: hypothetical protein WCV56_03680 [Candidatus Omnitrophota bacterium]
MLSERERQEMEDVRRDEMVAGLREDVTRAGRALQDREVPRFNEALKKVDGILVGINSVPFEVLRPFYKVLSKSLHNIREISDTIDSFSKHVEK